MSLFNFLRKKDQGKEKNNPKKYYKLSVGQGKDFESLDLDHYFLNMVPELPPDFQTHVMHFNQDVIDNFAEDLVNSLDEELKKVRSTIMVELDSVEITEKLCEILKNHPKSSNYKFNLSNNILTITKIDLLEPINVETIEPESIIDFLINKHRNNGAPVFGIFPSKSFATKISGLSNYQPIFLAIDANEVILQTAIEKNRLIIGNTNLLQEIKTIPHNSIFFGNIGDLNVNRELKVSDLKRFYGAWMKFIELHKRKSAQAWNNATYFLTEVTKTYINLIRDFKSGLIVGWLNEGKNFNDILFDHYLKDKINPESFRHYHGHFSEVSLKWADFKTSNKISEQPLVSDLYSLVLNTARYGYRYNRSLPIFIYKNSLYYKKMDCIYGGHDYLPIISK